MEGQGAEQLDLDDGERYDFNLLIYFPKLQSLFNKFAKCHHCNSPTKLQVDLSLKKGFCHTMKVFCDSCNAKEHFETSKLQNKLTRGRRGRPFYDINLRTVIAFREIGKGYESMKNFCAIMNMPKPMTRCSYDKCIDEIHWAYSHEKEISLQKVAASVNSANMLLNNTAKLAPWDCTVSMDGSYGVTSWTKWVTFMSCREM